MLDIPTATILNKGRNDASTLSHTINNMMEMRYLFPVLVGGK
jgi:hypothetical protein